MKIYCVHDVKAEAFMNPVYYRTKGEALRAFETTCKDSSSQFNKFPSDFTMYELGEFNEFNGSFNIHEKPLHMANASEFTE